MGFMPALAFLFSSEIIWEIFKWTSCFRVVLDFQKKLEASMEDSHIFRIQFFLLVPSYSSIVLLL